MDFDNIDLGNMKIRKVFYRKNPLSGIRECRDKTIKLKDLFLDDKMNHGWANVNPDEILDSWVNNLNNIDEKNILKII